MNAVLGDLPTWNLSDLYSSPGGSDLESDLKLAAEEAEAFARDYEGKIAASDGRALGAAVARYEAMQERMGRIGSYASLYYAQNQADPERGRFAQDVSEDGKFQQDIVDDELALLRAVETTDAEDCSYSYDEKVREPRRRYVTQGNRDLCWQW